MLKPTNIAELKTVLSKIWNDLLTGVTSTDKAIVSFHNRLRSCAAAVGIHSEHCKSV